MTSLIEALQTESTKTENGMPTHTSSLNACLDFFAIVGSARGWPEENIIAYFSKALVSDPLTAMKILFWSRDCRGGAGEREIFRTCVKYLASFNDGLDMIGRNAYLIPEYGRWDDLFELVGKTELSPTALKLIAEGLDKKNGLLAKWLPRKGRIAGTVRNFLKLSPKQYRKLIVGLSNTVEQKMCAKQWREIKYEQVPSQAMHKLRKAFARNDTERFMQFIADVKEGKTTIKAGTLYPYQLYDAFTKRENADALEAQWNALPNYMEGNPFRLLPVCDVSGSMNTNDFGGPTPMSVSISLGIYISERNKGIFKDAFITFSDQPTLQHLKGGFVERCKQLQKAHWTQNTNIEAVYTMLLGQAVKHHVPENEMPNCIMMLSDMQFDECSYNKQRYIQEPSETSLKMIRRMYGEAGYTMPNLVYWNINARIGQMPVQVTDRGVAIISGCSPSILKAVFAGDCLDPVSVMMNAINAERYNKITI